jgi:hypothetical protein
MKKIFGIMAVCAAVFGFAACEDKDGGSDKPVVQDGAVVDNIVGEWMADYFFAVPGMIGRSAHIVTINKIDNTTVEIVDFMGLTANMTGSVSHEMDTVIARVDNTNGTITIPSQKLLPTIDPQGFDTYFCRIKNDMYTDPKSLYVNWGVGFDKIPIAFGDEMKMETYIDLSTGGLPMGDLSDIPMFGSVVILSKDYNLPDKALWYNIYTTNTIWYKLPEGYDPDDPSTWPSSEGTRAAGVKFN